MTTEKITGYSVRFPLVEYEKIMHEISNCGVREGDYTPINTDSKSTDAVQYEFAETQTLHVGSLRRFLDEHEISYTYYEYTSSGGTWENVIHNKKDFTGLEPVMKAKC